MLPEGPERHAAGLRAGGGEPGGPVVQHEHQPAPALQHERLRPGPARLVRAVIIEWQHTNTGRCMYMYVYV